MIRVQQNIHRNTKKRCYQEIDQSIDQPTVVGNSFGPDIAREQLDEFKMLLNIQKKQIREFTNMLGECKELLNDIKIMHKEKNDSRDNKKSNEFDYYS